MRNFGSSGIRTQFLATLDKRLRPPGPTCWGDHNILCILFPLMPPCWKSTSLFLFCYFLTIFCSDWEYRYLEQSSRSPLKQGKKVCRIAGFWGSHQKFFKVTVLQCCPRNCYQKPTKYSEHIISTQKTVSKFVIIAAGQTYRPNNNKKNELHCSLAIGFSCRSQ